MRHTRSPVASPALANRSESLSSFENRPAYSWPSATMIAPLKGGQIDHEFRLQSLVHIVQHVGEHEAAFGIGIDDLDRLSRHGGDDVARPLRLAVGHILHHPMMPTALTLALRAASALHKADNAGRALMSPFISSMPCAG